MAGLTSCGRTTITALRLNNDRIVQARRLSMLVGLDPPLESSWKFGMPIRECLCWGQAGRFLSTPEVAYGAYHTCKLRVDAMENIL